MAVQKVALGSAEKFESIHPEVKPTLAVPTVYNEH
jgi:hypothetical protein